MIKVSKPKESTPVNPKQRLDLHYTSDEISYIEFMNNFLLHELHDTSPNKITSTERIVMFFRYIFGVLELNGTCFSSGAFVFEDAGNLLFNLLTFDRLLVDRGSYHCNDPLHPIDTSIQVNEDIHVVATQTHDGFYRKDTGDLISIKPKRCIPLTSMVPLRENRFETKFERLLKPKLRNICGRCNRNQEREYAEDKGVILYYPFQVTSNTYPNRRNTTFERTISMLYVKFEHASLSEEFFKHSTTFAQSLFGIKKKYEGLAIRKEDDTRCDYEKKYEEIDFEIYVKYCQQDTIILDWYNTYIRIGCEFFISKNLLFVFYRNFLIQNFDCNISEQIESEVSNEPNRYARTELGELKEPELKEPEPELGELKEPFETSPRRSPRAKSPSHRSKSPSHRSKSPSPRSKSPSPRSKSPSHRSKSPSPGRSSLRGKSPSPGRLSLRGKSPDRKASHSKRIGGYKSKMSKKIRENMFKTCKTLKTRK